MYVCMATKKKYNNYRLEPWIRRFSVYFLRTHTKILCKICKNDFILYYEVRLNLKG